MWVAQHDRSFGQLCAKFMWKSIRNFVAQCFQHFENRNYIRWWNVIIFYQSLKLSKILVCLKKGWKLIVFFKLLLDDQSWSSIIHSFQFLFQYFFLPHDSYACLLSTTKFLMIKWSMTSWSKLQKTCNFENSPKYRI